MKDAFLGAKHPPAEQGQMKQEPALYGRKQTRKGRTKAQLAHGKGKLIGLHLLMVIKIQRPVMHHRRLAFFKAQAIIQTFSNSIIFAHL